MDREGDGAVTSARKIAPCDRALRVGGGLEETEQDVGVVQGREVKKEQGMLCF